jgi:AraC-like DNA-binding protein/mannose-6-phosphate isomerase-like protein (cupin superfamily)
MNNLTIHPEVRQRPDWTGQRRVVAYVLNLNRGGGLPPHHHPRAQLLAVTSGSIAVAAEGSTFIAPPERAIWVPANTLHETRHLASTQLHTLYVATDGDSSLPRRTSVIQINSLLRELLNVIIARPRHYDEDGADGRVVSVLLDQLAGSRPLPLHLPIPKTKRLSSVANRLLEAPAEAPPIAEIARSLTMSPRTLERQFKSETGITLRSFRRQAKLFRALELLSMKMSVSEVSDTLGFGDPSAFVSMFRSAFGITPGRYLANPNRPARRRV